MMPTSVRRILVLGATSLIGRRLVEGPRPRDVALTALSRRPPPDGGGGVEWIAGDLTLPGVAEGLPAADTVLSLSPIWLLAPAMPALLATGVRRIVAVSSTSRLTKTDSPVAAEREVARRLAAGEDALVSACEAAAVAWTVLRPTMIYDEGRDANVSRLARLIARFGAMPLAGEGSGLRQPVHSADLATAVWQVLEAPVTANRIYATPGGETLSYRQMVERLFEGLGRRPRVICVPPAAWRLGVALAGPFLTQVTTAMGDRMSRDLTFDAGPAARDFGYAPRPFRPDFSGVTAISRG